MVSTSQLNLMLVVAVFCVICGVTKAVEREPERQPRQQVALGTSLNDLGRGVADLESSETFHSGYHGVGYTKGSIIGGLLGDITANALRQIFRSLSGIGMRLGLNLNQEIYNVHHGHYGHGGGYRRNGENGHFSQRNFEAQSGNTGYGNRNGHY